MFQDFFTYSHLAGFLSGLAGFIFFGWIVFRTRSWYIFKYFLWRMFHGKGGITDPTIKGYLGEQSSLMLFRFVAVDAETNKDARGMIRWAKSKNISLETVGRAGDYFDSERRCIKEKKVKGLGFDRGAFGMLSVVLMLVMLPVLLTFATSRAILIFKVSKQWFLLGQDSAKTLFVWQSEELEKEQCALPKLGDVAKTRFLQSDAASICKFWLEPKTPAYIEKTVHEQRVAGGWSLLVLGLISLGCWRASGKAAAALKVHNKLSMPSKQEEPVNQDLQG
ncbi:DUF6216 family protein [Dyella sp.]|uniref:DUF6216 family protein n=1 Tax=Dyella sp. TaxID=1869338 RepID=UPI002851B185|nr:DUF6216 family protein [Dyella sp.]MDR3445407.1 DUF6216 family protein [Dyella sp.]